MLRELGGKNMFKLGEVMAGLEELALVHCIQCFISTPRLVPQRYNAGLVIECNLVSKVTLIESQHTALEDLSACWFCFKFLNEYAQGWGWGAHHSVWTENLKAGTHLQSMPHQGR